MSTALAPRTGTLADLTPGTWTVDPTHSSVGFTARHLMITKVHGHFNDFDGVVTIADDPLASSVEANVRLASVDTGNADRDGHLHSADFFDVEHHPVMNLRSTGITEKNGGYVLDADLTIAGQTHPVAFSLEFDGVTVDPFENTKAGFTAAAEINRSDWGLNFNMALETGGVVVSEKIKIELDIQLIRTV